MMDEVDEKTFNVRPILILQKSLIIIQTTNYTLYSVTGTRVQSDLICHYHELAVAQALE